MSGAGGFLLDTHIWWWSLIGSDRLPAGLRRKLDGAGGALWLSPISVWELGMLVEKGRVEIDGDFRAWADEAERRMPLHEAPLTREVALKSRELRFAHGDPADRFLAATSLVFGLTLVTLDRRLSRARWLPTVSS